MTLTVGVLALQGGFLEHLSLLRKASQALEADGIQADINFVEVRTEAELSRCGALVIPGGESTTLSLVAAQSGLLDPLRVFVKQNRRPTWGTCAGLIMLSEAASATKRGGQELIGGLDVKVHRNHFGRQVESFVTDLDLRFLGSSREGQKPAPFPGVFIRAPVVEEILAQQNHVGSSEVQLGEQSSLPKKVDGASSCSVEVLGVLPGRHASVNTPDTGVPAPKSVSGAGDIIALRQGNVFGTSFHPELTVDIRIHKWWLEQAIQFCSKDGEP